MGEGELEAGFVKCPGCEATWHWVMGDAAAMVCPACGREIPRPAEGAGEDEMGFGSWLEGIEKPASSAAPAQEVSVEEAMRVLKGHTPVSAPEPVEAEPAEPEPEPQPEEERPVEVVQEEPPKAEKKGPPPAPQPKPVPLPQGAPSSRPAPRPQPAPRRRPVRRPMPPQPPPAAEAAEKPAVRKVRVWTLGAKFLVFLLMLCVLGAGGAAGYFYWMLRETRESHADRMRRASTAQHQVKERERALKEANERASRLSAEVEELKKGLARATAEAREALGKEFKDLQAGLAEKTKALDSLEKEAGQARRKLAEAERELQLARGRNETLRRTARKEMDSRKKSEEKLARIERATLELPSDLSQVELRNVVARQAGKLREITARLEKVALGEKRSRALPEFTRGLELLMSFDAEGARRSFEGATEAAPSWPEADLYLGFALYRLGEDEAAVKAFERASGLGPRAQFHLGEVRRSAGDERGAIEAWERGAKGGGPFAYLCSSNLALLRSDAYRAVDGARSALREGASWEARVALGRALVALGGKKNLSEALKELGAAATTQRWDPRPLVALGELRLEQKNARLASLAGKGALRLRPSSAEARILLARVYVLRGSKQAALGELGKAIELRPSFAPARLERGRLLVSSGKLDAALRDLDEAVESSPGNVDALIERARVRDMKGLLDEALRDAAAAAEKAPKNVRVHVLRGDLLCKGGKHAEALKAYTSACSLDHLDVGAVGKLVGLLLKEGTPVRDVPGAVLKGRELVLATSRTNPEALTLLAMALFASGDAAGAARVQREAFTISSSPEHSKTMREYEKAAQRK